MASKPPLGVSLASFTSIFDRFAISPILVFIATHYDEPLFVATSLAGLYYLCYGLIQPVWGLLSDRYGRIRIMQVGLIGASLAGAASALSPSILSLLIARGFAGAFWGGVVANGISYIGDTTPRESRQSSISDLLAVTALGTAVATAAAGILAETVDWRVVFLLPTVLAPLAVIFLQRLPERTPSGEKDILKAMSAPFRSSWALLIVVFAFVEGALVLGLLTLLAPAAQTVGVNASTAGLAVAAFGLSSLVGTRIVRALSRRLSLTTIGGVGAGFLVLGFVPLTLNVSVISVAHAAVSLGFTWAFLHSSLLAWTTELLPHARGALLALFSASLFTGSSVGALLAGAWGPTGHWGQTFGAATFFSIALFVSFVIARDKYQKTK